MTDRDGSVAVGGHGQVGVGAFAERVDQGRVAGHVRSPPTARVTLLQLFRFETVIR